MKMPEALVFGKEIEEITLQAADKIHEKRKAVDLLRKKGLGVPLSGASSS